MPRLKVVLSVLFVLLVAFFVARGCVHRRTATLPEVPKKVLKKKVVKASRPLTQPAVAPAPGAARMAIILDDWGRNEGLVADAVAVGRPLTLSVLPKLPYSARIADEAYAAGLGVMLHMPMQPKNLSAGLEPQTILTTTPEPEIARYLDEALASVPHVEGVNNHMGSAATSDERVMRTVLKYLKARGLYFIDSNTISSTVGPRVANETGIRFARRQVFLDNDVSLDAVKTQLRRAARIALTKGRVIAIGHDKKVTLRAIREMVPEIEKAGVKLVLSRDLLEKKA